MIEWLPLPDRLTLQDHSVHVWAVELDDETFDSIQGHSLLSPDEQGRAARFKFERDRRRYIVAHFALHDILAGYLNAIAADLQFLEVLNGKPKLAPPFATGDIEFVKADFPFSEVADRFFTAKEVAGLRALPVQLQRQAFYKCWTSKEAFLKAKGTGLSGKLDEVEIILEGDERVRIDARVSGWSLAELNPGDGYEAALVSAGEATHIHVYRWQPAR